MADLIRNDCPREFEGEGSDAGAELAKKDGYTAEQGLLWKDGKMIPLPQADTVASRYGFMYAEMLVRALRGE